MQEKSLVVAVPFVHVSCAWLRTSSNAAVPVTGGITGWQSPLSVLGGVNQVTSKEQFDRQVKLRAVILCCNLKTATR